MHERGNAEMGQVSSLLLLSLRLPLNQTNFYNWKARQMRWERVEGEKGKGHCWPLLALLLSLWLWAVALCGSRSERASKPCSNQSVPTYKQSQREREVVSSHFISKSQWANANKKTHHGNREEEKGMSFSIFNLCHCLFPRLPPEFR